MLIIKASVLIDKINNRIKMGFYNRVLAPLFFDKIYSEISKIKVMSIHDTAKKLTESNASIGRFGDGEISWMEGKKNNKNDFEVPSTELSNRLREVFNSNEEGYLIGVNDSIRSIDELTSFPKKYWKMYFLQRYRTILKFFDKNKQYYNANITRPYIDYNYRKVASDDFEILKKIWMGKNILIVEGDQTKLGANDDLFDGANDIKRIECPCVNAFSSYDEILDKTIEFLENHKDYITLSSLGPTATVLSYDLFMKGYRSIDIGHIDVEYEWYKMGVKEKVNIPYKYINELPDGHSTEEIQNDDYNRQIIYHIKKKGN